MPPGHYGSTPPMCADAMTARERISGEVHSHFCWVRKLMWRLERQVSHMRVAKNHFVFLKPVHLNSIWRYASRVHRKGANILGQFTNNGGSGLLC
jgi:hypothetical protein